MNRSPRKPLVQDATTALSLLSANEDGRSWQHIPSCSEHAYRQLSRLICSGLLRAGDVLPSERLLGKVFDIARGTLRIALDRLQSDGAVRITHGKNTLVTGDPLLGGTPFGGEAAAWSVAEAQRVILYARRLAASSAMDMQQCRIDSRTPSRLRMLVELQKAAPSLPQFVIVDRQFHAELQASCDAHELSALLCLAEALMHGALRDAFEAQTVRSEVIKQHQAIAEAVNRKDIFAAIATLSDQLEMRIAAHQATPCETP
jgi:DNA-binding FadR family transcriptional regulator